MQQLIVYGMKFLPCFEGSCGLIICLRIAGSRLIKNLKQSRKIFLALLSRLAFRRLAYSIEEL